MMNIGTSIKQREIVLVHFPFTDLVETKQRPALVLSDSRFNSLNEDVICCAITSNPREYYKDTVINQTDMEEGVLYKESKIRSNKLFTLSKSIILKKIGKLNRTKSEEVASKLQEIIRLKE